MATRPGKSKKTDNSQKALGRGEPAGRGKAPGRAKAPAGAKARERARASAAKTTDSAKAPGREQPLGAPTVPDHAKTPDPQQASDREIVISRVIAAPRSLVFKVATHEKHLAHWWGPKGFTISTLSFDYRRGGVWKFIMHGPDGTDYPNHIKWREVVPPERLVYRHGESEDDPNAFTGSLTLVERGKATEVTLRAVFNTKEQRDEAVEKFGAIEGGKQTLGRLAKYVPTVAKER